MSEIVRLNAHIDGGREILKINNAKDSAIQNHAKMSGGRVEVGLSFRLWYSDTQSEEKKSWYSTAHFIN